MDTQTTQDLPFAPAAVHRGLAPHKLHQVLSFIEERITEPIGIRHLAAEVNMSQFHFARMFKEAMGDPPHEYITRVRMERAKKLLAASNLSLRQVATTVGYQTQAHFTGVFHKRVGMTPRTFRVRSQSEREGQPARAVQLEDAAGS